MQTARTASQGHAPSAPPSIEEVRRRARHRLIGAAVLVLLGVIGFSLLFDTQPRSLPVDIPIVIPSKGAAPAPAAAKAPAASAPVPEKPVAEKPASAAAAPVAASESLGPREEVVSTAPAPKPEARPEEKPVPRPATQPKPETKPDSKPEAKPVTKPADADRARALLDGQTADKPDAVAQRIVVQVGAFADVARAREARLKLERAGLKTYTHVAETADGKRIRVRVGPFATKAEADKAAARVKALGLPAAILTL